MRRTRFTVALAVPSLVVLAAVGSSPGSGLAESADRPPVDRTVSAPEPAVPAAGARPQATVSPRSVTSATTGIDAAFRFSGVTAGKVGGLLDLPDTVASAYAVAVASAPESCHIDAPMLAAIGQVESGNLAGRTIDKSHRVTPAVIGPRLDGRGFAAVPDTDAGRLDGDKKWDRAVGPMQFLPSTWRYAGVDMDQDGKRDPQDVFDAAGAAMVYLCASGGDLSTAAGTRKAVLSYNHSTDYLAQVLAWRKVFATAGTVPTGSYASWAGPTTVGATTPAKPARPVHVRVPHGPRPGQASGPLVTPGKSGTPGKTGTSGTSGTTTGTTPTTGTGATPGTPGATPKPGTPKPTDGTTPGGNPTPGSGHGDGGSTPTPGGPSSPGTPTPGTGTPTPTTPGTPTPTTPADTTTEVGPLPGCPVPSPLDPAVLVDAVTGLPVPPAFGLAVPVDPASTTPPTTTDVDHPTACLPVIDPRTGLPATGPLPSATATPQG